MAEMLEKVNTNNEVTYTFRFTDCNKSVRLNQKQLDRIPYLAALVEHKDDFLSTRNKKGEYLLNPPIYYSWFIAILHTINSKQLYTLFTELPEDDTIIGTIQLFDYLGIISFDSPLCTEEHFVLSNIINNDNENTSASNRRRDISVTRNQAAEFVVALIKIQYDLFDSDGINELVSLIEVILTRPNVFSSRFRHHTLTIVKEYCFPIFTREQKRHLITLHQNNQKQRQLNSFMYLYEDHNPLPDDFYSSFSWKRLYKLAEANINISLERIYNELWSRWVVFPSDRFFLWGPPSLPLNLRYLDKSVGRLKTWEEVDMVIKKQEVQSARSGHFNTLPKRPKVDKFKHRCGPKVQKYR